MILHDISQMPCVGQRYKKVFINYTIDKLSHKCQQLNAPPSLKTAVSEISLIITSPARHYKHYSNRLRAIPALKK